MILHRVLPKPFHQLRVAPVDQRKDTLPHSVEQALVQLLGFLLLLDEQQLQHLLNTDHEALEDHENRELLVVVRLHRPHSAKNRALSVEQPCRAAPKFEVPELGVLTERAVFGLAQFLLERQRRALERFEDFPELRVV